MVGIPSIYGDEWGMVYGIAIPTLLQISVETSIPKVFQSSSLPEALAENLRSVGRGQLQLFEFSYTRSVHGLSAMLMVC